MSNTDVSLNKPEWDYSLHAESYAKRPNYAEESIVKLCDYVQASQKKEYVAADIGAGTGNLTVLMQDKIGSIFSVEPNKEMRTIGIERTESSSNIQWKVGTGEEIPLEDKSVDLVTFGSSFNTTDREQSLKESYRILKDDGYFACMWNNRDLTIPTQTKTEEIIKRYYPDYSHGTRRQQQADVILESGLFNNVYYYETPQEVLTEVEDFCEAWRSVKNNFWDLNTKEGKDTFEKILTDIREEFKDQDKLKLIYVTRIWIAKKQN